MPKKKVRKLSDAQFLQLLKVAAGLLQHTNGDLVQALSMAMVKHHALLRLIRDQELVTDLGPGNAILFVPDEGASRSGSSAIPATTPKIAPTEEAPYPEIDLLGFEVIESGTTHKSQPLLDAGVFSDDWD